MLEPQTLSAVALVTGAANGIGRDTAFSFAQAGCIGVVFADKDEEGAKAAADDSVKYATNPKYKSTASKVDVSDLKNVQATVKTAVEAHSRIDYLVNSAGIGNNTQPHPVGNLDYDHFNLAIDTNLKGTVHCISEVIKVMLGQDPLDVKPSTAPWQKALPSISRGAIVNIVSAYAFFVQKGTLTYNASKHRLMGVTKAAAIDHAHETVLE